MSGRIFVLAIALVACQPAAAPSETARLATLGRVWGFVKYHHPALAEPGGDWDGALLEAIPGVRDPGRFRATLGALVAKAGIVGRPSAWSPAGPATAWLSHDSLLDDSIVQQLEAMRVAERPPVSAQVAAAGAGNASFLNEQAYATTPYPDVDLRLLALFRFWNAVNFFFADRELIDGGWDRVLDDFLPRFIAAPDARAYHELVAELAVRTCDGHAFLTSSVLDANAPRGARLTLRQLGNQTVVVRRGDGGGEAAVGDVVTAIDGVPIARVRERALRLAPGSNPPARDRIANRWITRSTADHLDLTVERADGRHFARVPTYAQPEPESIEPPWYRLGDVGVIQMKTLTREAIAPALAALGDTSGIVFDMRTYPGFLIFDLVPYLHATPAPFATVWLPDLRRPGTFGEPQDVVVGGGRAVVYPGKIVVIVDESTMSLAEYFTMALQSVPGAMVVGSQTAGADGNVSTIALPGGITARFSGLVVHYPDGRATQRTGIRIDVVVRPTVAGIRAGRDEVRERAIAVIHSSKVTPANLLPDRVPAN